jgi:predicted MFS family arabinose efflux permease
MSRSYRRAVSIDLAPKSSPPSQHLEHRATYRLLAGQYVTQFLGGSFLATALPTILREAGAGLDQLAVVRLLMIIPVAKVVWAPLVDHVSARTGKYRSWLLVLQPAMALALLVLVLTDPVEDLGLVVAVMVAVALISSTKDTAVDALAIRTLPPQRRSVASGIQSAGATVGGLIGGGLVVVAYDHLGWVPAVVVLVLAVAVPIWQIVRFRESPLARSRPPTVRQSYGVLHVLVRPGLVRRWALGVAPLFWLGIGAAYGLLTPMLVDAGWSLSRIGLTVNGVGAVVAVAAALVTGRLAARLGLRRCLHLAAGCQAIALLALLPVAAGSASTVVATVGVCLFEVAFAVAATAAGATAMNLCRAGAAGADYALINGAALLVSFAAGALGVAVAGTVGYVWVLVAAVVAAMASHVALLGFWRRPDPDRPQSQDKATVRLGGAVD